MKSRNNLFSKIQIKLFFRDTILMSILEKSLILIIFYLQIYKKPSLCFNMPTLILIQLALNMLNILKKSLDNFIEESILLVSQIEDPTC